MSKIVKISDSNYRLIVKADGLITLDTGNNTGLVFLTGKLNVKSNVSIGGNLNIDGDSITTSSLEFNLLNTTATTINAFGDADLILIGHSNTDVIIQGNLTVNGATTTVNSTTLTVDDKNIELGSIASPTNTTADGGGITLKGTTDKTFNWVNTTSSWTSSEHLDLFNNKTYKINTTEVLSANTLFNSQSDIYIAPSSTTVTIGGLNGTTTINNDLTVNGTFNDFFIRVTENTLANSGEQIIADTTAAPFTITLPATPSTGTKIRIIDGGNWAVNNLTIDRNSSLIDGASQNLVLNKNGNQGDIEFIFTGTTWKQYVNLSGIRAINDTTSTVLYPIMTAVAGVDQLSKVTTSKLYFNAVTGDLNSTNFNSLSDITEKTNVLTLNDPITKINKLRGVSFNWLDTNNAGLGVIAQEVEEIFPELIVVNSLGKKTVNYNGLMAVLIESIKTLIQEVETLKQHIN